LPLLRQPPTQWQRPRGSIFCTSEFGSRCAHRQASGWGSSVDVTEWAGRLRCLVSSADQCVHFHECRVSRGPQHGDPRLAEIIREFRRLSFPKKTPPLGSQESAKALEAVQDETIRAARINALAVVTGVTTAAIAYVIGVLTVATHCPEVVIYGMLAGAGSGF
jgi:hypothetical protein